MRLSRISAVLAAALAFSAVAAAAPGDVRAELSPPGIQTAVKVGDRLEFGGEVPPGSEPSGRLDAMGTGGSVLGSYDVSSRVTNNAGVVSGGVTVGCFYVPGCIDAVTEAERDSAFDALVGYRLTLTVAGVSDTSNRVDFDDDAPIILGYQLRGPTTVRVLFSEDVRDPEGDSRFDWEIEGDRTAVTSVSGTGNSRTLTLRVAQDGNATPEVRYLPLPSPNANVPNIPYVDGARNQLDADNRFSLAADRIAPPDPTISSVDGRTVSYEQDDVAVPVIGSNPSPRVVVGNVPAGNTAQLYLDDGDGRFDPDTGDQLVGTAPGGAGDTATITVDRALPDAVHRFYVQSVDSAACDPNSTSGTTCPNRSGRSKEARYDLETVPPTPVGDALGRSNTITLLFSEPLFGANAAGHWTVINAGGPVTVTGVSGFGSNRTLRYTGGPLVPPTTTVTYTPPASNAYADEHGNRMAGFTISVVAAPLPVLAVTPADVEEGNPPGGLVPPPAPTIDYTLTLSDDIPAGESVDVAFTTVAGAIGDAVGANDGSGDYVTRSGTVTITGQDGPDQAVVSVTVTRDLLDEFDEAVFLEVRNVDPGAPQFVLPGGTASLTTAATIIDDDALAVVRVAEASRNVRVAEGGSTQVTVELDVVSGKAVSVAWATENDGTAEVSDAPAQSGTVTIPAGARSVTFDVVADDDEEDEEDETFSALLSAPVNATLGVARAVITIEDDDIPIPTLTVDGGSVSEEASNLPLSAPPRLVYTFRLSTAPEQPIEVGWTTGDAGTAVAGKDFTAKTGTVTFGVGQTETTASVVVTDDKLDEDDETVALEVVEPAGADLVGGGDQLTVFGTIVDDDLLPTVAFASGSTAVVIDEGEQATLSVRLTPVSGRDVTVEWQTAFDGDAGLEDLDAQTGTVVIPEGETSATFLVDTKDDDQAEDDETFSVVLSAPVNAELATSGTRSRITIADDEVVVPTLSVQPVTTSEDPGALPPLTSPTPLSFVVTLNRAASVPVTVEYGTRSNGSATAGLDYEAIGGTLTIPQGELSATLPPVNIIDDTLDEFDETLLMRFTNSNGARLAGGVPALDVLGTITDDDPLVEVTLQGAEVEEGEPATMTVSLDVVSGKEIELAYETSDGSASGGDDYDVTAGTLIIPAGQTSGSFTVPTRDDATVEGDEDLTVTITSVRSETANVLNDGRARLTILDDDVPLEGVPVLSMSSATVQEGDPATLPIEPAPVLAFQLRLSESSSEPVQVSYATSGGTATSGEDFVGATGSKTIPAGELTATIEITVTPDLVDEFDEQMTLAVTGVTSNAQLPAKGLARTGRILDDDPLTSIAFADDSVDLGVAEGGSVELTVELVGPTAKDATFTWRTSFDGLATTSDADAQQGTVTIPAGDTTARFVVTTRDDDIDEPSESFSVVLADPVNATLDDARTTSARITLVDDELLASVLSITGGTVGEADGGPLAFLDPAQLVWELSLDTASEVDVTVDWSTIDSGSATAGSDYDARSGTLRIPAGATTATVSVDVIDDALDEFDEDVVLRLSNIRGGVLSGGGSRLDEAGTITDDDPLAIASLSDDQTVGEGEPATFTVALDTVSGKTIVVRLRSVDGSARAGQDYTAIDREITIPAGQTERTVTIQTLDDSLVEDEEDLQLQLSVVTDDAVALGERIAARLSVTDDDVLPVDPDAIGVSLTGASVDEGNPLPGGLVLPGTRNTLDFVVRLSKAADQDIQLAFVTRPGSATAGQDYVARSGTVTVPAGATEITIPVEVIGDELDEDDEELHLEITSASGDAVLPANGLVRTGRILDDDAASALRIGDVGVIEGDDALLDVSLDRASGRTIRVSWAIVEGTATAADVGATSGTLSFLPGTTRQTITLPTIEDGVTEGIEQLQVQLQNPVNATISDPLGTLTIVDVGGPPLVQVGDARAVEGDTGQKSVRVTVTLTSPSPTDTEVSWASQRVTATPDEDYLAPGGTIVIPAGVTSGQITVTFLGDTEVEPDEDFLVTLTGSDAFIADPVGRVTIVNDDVATDPGDGDGGDGGGGTGTDGGQNGAPDVGDGGEGQLPATGGGGAALAMALLGFGAFIHRRRD